MNNLVKGATLLSVEEVYQIPEELRHFVDGRWWLRSPGIDTYDAAGVGYYGRVYKYGYYVNFTCACVRPALQLESEISDLKDGDKIKIGGYEFDVVCDGAYALCTTSIGEHVFRKNWEAEDSNVYEASDIKKFVDRWFEANIKGQRVTKVIISENEIGIA